MGSCNSTYRKCQRSGCHRNALVTRSRSGRTFRLSRYCIDHTCEVRGPQGSFCPSWKHSNAEYCRRHEDDRGRSPIWIRILARAGRSCRPSVHDTWKRLISWACELTSLPRIYSPEGYRSCSAYCCRFAAGERAQ